ncbi:precorrin-3B C(17)-methyltransferase [Cupriavidus sp. BIC8F]|uniref:precorrin-3B C(17)-methyltransferase n=1 Tax=Cupriavidus sp. BIC8F TaxID=3079014 RepID=UPI0029163DB2|nr:precorrin-3B C(17)-methyltransferase [Cupriavidus sp. BIC8F]
MATLNTLPAIVVLGPSALPTARRIQHRYPGARLYGLHERIEANDADATYTNLGKLLRGLYRSNTPLVVLCAAGIVIRCLASALADKGAEPPVLAVAEDGSAVVPLLGGLAGVNVLAREIAAALDTTPAITTSGELRFGTCLLNPPEGYRLASIEQGKHFVSSLLAGQSARLEGEAPWLDGTGVPLDSDARLSIRVSESAWQGNPDELLIHPQCVIAAIADTSVPIGSAVRDALDTHGIAAQSLAALLVARHRLGDESAAQAAAELNVPLRGIHTTGNDAQALLDAAMPSQPGRVLATSTPGVALAVSPTPWQVDQIGHARGKLSVIGLGPGTADLLTPAARRALDEATDILGYETYVRMAGPFRPDQRLHCTDNREELQRARHAFELATSGQRVVVVSSGDPGVFAMAAAVLEALDQGCDPAWAQVELAIVPGVSAAMATAAVAGAPLGHDFCILSLSDNLKPWDTIETRLRHAAEGDFVMAFYNPISRARPWQLDRALEVVRAVRGTDTPVVLGRDIGRPAAALTTTTLGALRSEQVDMRTMVIIGSSTTRTIARGDGAAAAWVYTPRWYPVPPDKPIMAG